VRDVVAAGNLAHWLAVVVAATDRLPLLVFGQFRFAAELDAAFLGAFPSFAGAVRIKSLSNSPSPPRTVSIQAAVCRGGGSPCVAERAETGLLAGDRRKGVQQVAGGSRQPVEPCHHQHVAGDELVKRRVTKKESHMEG
jgi:hypothetical protein